MVLIEDNNDNSNARLMDGSMLSQRQLSCVMRKRKILIMVALWHVQLRRGGCKGQGEGRGGQRHASAEGSSR